MNQEQRRILTTIAIEISKIVFAGSIAAQFLRQKWDIPTLIGGALLSILCFVLAFYLNRGG